MVIFLGCSLNACTQAEIRPAPTNPTAPSVKVFTETSDPTFSSTATITQTPTLENTPTLIPLSSACSPLAGIQLSELHKITSNPFVAPTLFTDTGHPAVDLAFFTFKQLKTMYGHPVQAIFPGRVVQVIHDRFPYGFMIMIETPTYILENALIQSLRLPTPIPPENIEAFSQCKPNQERISWSEESTSLYTLYSHLETEPLFSIGDQVACGDVIGKVGISGNSVAEHLHLEIRLGPSKANFGTIASYQPDATDEERYNYCIWSHSGVFQPVDPSRLWTIYP